MTEKQLSNLPDEFLKMRELMSANKEVLVQLEKVEKKLTHHDEDIARIFGYLKQLLSPPQQMVLKKDLKDRDELR